MAFFRSASPRTQIKRNGSWSSSYIVPSSNVRLSTLNRVIGTTRASYDRDHRRLRLRAAFLAAAERPTEPLVLAALRATAERCAALRRDALHACLLMGNVREALLFRIRAPLENCAMKFRTTPALPQPE